MAWQDVMLPMLRVMVNDIAEAVYQDDTLEQTLVVAAFQVCRELPSFQLNVDIENVDMTPDPTFEESRDDSFVNLVCLKAACIIDTGAAAKAAGQAISVKDGSSSIDLRGALEGRLAMLQKGWCSIYQDTKWSYQMQGAGAAGAAVMTPFRVFASTYSSYRESRLQNRI